jgi:hypothetical protein
MKTVEVFQVLNESGCPAGGSFEDLAIFETEKEAKRWIEYLQEEICIKEDFTIIKRRLA